jgi:hypothetical protein
MRRGGRWGIEKNSSFTLEVGPRGIDASGRVDVSTGTRSDVR